MRPRPGVVVAICAVVLLVDACGSSRSTEQLPGGPAGARGHKAAARPARRVIHTGVRVERLPAPAGLAFRPTCPSRTTIGTVTGQSVTARTRPSSDAPAIATFPRRNEQGARQVFDILATASGAGGQRWYKALLPMRPNDTLGYIRADRLALSWTPYWILVERAAFRLRLFRSCHGAATFPVGIGTGSTPTPVGYFYLQSLLRPPDPSGVYGAYAYGLSGYSGVIHDWRWGGLVGLHGTNDPSGIGHQVSHGCIRMLNRHITWLVRLLPLGTPVTIV
ncbi:MAG: L,D-transpeptidase [Actinomycetota bacterium]